MYSRRIVPIGKSGLTFFKWIECPQQVCLKDEDNCLHIYKQDDVYASLVVSAFSKHYAFDRYATDEETEAWFAEKNRFKKGCNSAGSELQN